ALLAAQKVTVLSQTPSAFYALQAVRAMGGEDLPPLHLDAVVLAGEAVEPGRLRTWWRDHPDTGTRLINMYGTTETTVHASFRELTPADAEATASPIGVPLTGLAFFVLDSSLGEVGVGVVGELYVVGGGVAD
ncbi:AMP-binding protein, partial [Nocardia sp. 2]